MTSNKAEPTTPAQRYAYFAPWVAAGRANDHFSHAPRALYKRRSSSCHFKISSMPKRPPWQTERREYSARMGSTHRDGQFLLRLFHGSHSWAGTRGSAVEGAAIRKKHVTTDGRVAVSHCSPKAEDGGLLGSSPPSSQLLLLSFHEVGVNLPAGSFILKRRFFH